MVGCCCKEAALDDTMNACFFDAAEPGVFCKDGFRLGESEKLFGRFSFDRKSLLLSTGSFDSLFGGDIAEK